ncbi:sulfur carrier protein ThiS [Deinococcus maricopensis]|uniref:Thiamine biosynthesis protein ThiS n=1 Tax=Deinococcus maricopensis (strain DSM 21211 / LMG 22137 / NRRL B-23946 / LB-34) TaxID=709986 RepID=E8U9W1_DEIML|nr:sulfur carrier protein ThiS [Deinococcus maricopensis]ADV67850.1 thiamine biosynthesis protein ThiS [Deinococcus maricopensis DSM 21211]
MTVNGQPHTFAPGLTLLGLLRTLSVDPARVAVAVNDDFYPGARIPDRELTERDVIEIVRITGGG